MHRSYTYLFPKGSRHDTAHSKEALLAMCRYPLQHADIHRIVLPKANLIRQQLVLNPVCFVDMLQVDAQENLTLKYRVKAGLVSLLFMLEGEAICLNELGWELSLAKANRLQAKYEQKGIYGIGFTCKKNISLSIAFHPEWLQSTYQNLEHIMLLLQHFLDASVPYMSLPACGINGYLKGLLESIYALAKGDRSTWGFLLLGQLTEILKYYDEIVDEKMMSGMYRAKTYLDGHLGQGPIGNEWLADHACMSISALIRNFRKELGTSPHEYQKEQRMRLAHELLARKMPPKEVFSLVGYSDVNTFRHEYNKWRRKTQPLAP